MEGTGTGAPGRKPPVVIAVVVTYNRRQLLLEALAAVHSQSRGPDAVIVVDNASADGTAAEVRSRYPSVRLAELARNTGGAGGFACGMALALAAGADLVWLMDDDTVPGPDALRALLDARERLPAPPPVLVASRVLWTDGRAHPMNTPRVKPFASRAERAAAATAGCLPIRSASFVSVLVDAGVCRQRGLPQADYFLWNDDFEFTTRLLRGNTGLLCPASVVTHKTAAFAATDTDPGERFFYEVRNKIWMLKTRAPLAPAERVLYAGSTLRRWARTFARSRDRGTLRRSLASGIAAGLRTGPRPTEQVLAEAGLRVPEAQRRSLLWLGPPGNSPCTDALARGVTMADDRAANEPGVVTKLSPRPVDDTVTRLVGMLGAKGVKLFTVIDQSAEAHQVGLQLRGTTLVIFGNPAAGTPVMAAAPMAALDLPLKVLVWDDGGQTKVSYYAPAELAARHGLGPDLEKKLAAIDTLTDALVASA